MIGAIYTPSFYGFVAWTVAYALYLTRFLPWEETDLLPQLMFITQIVVFAASTLLFSRFYPAGPDDLRFPRIRPPANWQVALLHALGFAGIAKFILDFSPFLAAGFFPTLFTDSSKIRALGAEMTSVGLQLSYFGWIAIAATLMHRKPNKILLLMAVVQFAANFIFVDRTRPVWILFTSMLCFVYFRPWIGPMRFVRYLFWLGLVFVAIFLIVALWSGKTGEGLFGAGVNPLAASIYLYFTSSFAYLGHIIDVETVGDFGLQRVLAAFYNVLALFSVVEPPPSQILEFYDVPFPTNVGTGLEPFYRDGGVFFAVFGMLVYGILFNLLGVLLLRKGNGYSVFAWANLCFCNVIGFFTAKLGNFSFVLLITIGVIGLVVHQVLQVLMRTSERPGARDSSGVAI